ncbi:hypothetical protein PIB30_034711 [Stylosanthes scabra]|uniref:Uncharacterized protein n=1 Tax=Stylosanthes scabra TaxID=79078 RepID=A0ABU6UCR0_9FABA|nr:hypothetical protein [Stylosanthes scabra]
MCRPRLQFSQPQKDRTLPTPHSLLNQPPPFAVVDGVILAGHLVSQVRRLTTIAYSNAAKTTAHPPRFSPTPTPVNHAQPPRFSPSQPSLSFRCHRRYSTNQDLAAGEKFGCLLLKVVQ